MTALIIAAIVAGILVLAARSKKKKQQPERKPGWYIGPVIHGRNYSAGMPERPTPQGSGWYFDFPTDPASHVHYVQWFSPPPLVAGRQIVIRFTITGGGFIAQEYPQNPALVSLLIQRKGDDWGAQGPMQSYRWFSRQTVTLAEGEHELTVPLTVAHWGDVFNGQDAAAFAAAIRDVDNIALIFGSDGGRGHGVYATQPSRFTLLSCETS